jgi:hypothetical protein
VVVGEEGVGEGGDGEGGLEGGEVCGCNALVVIKDSEFDWSWGDGRHGWVCSGLSVYLDWGDVAVISNTIEV